jgi:predicted nucleic acid-binding protein
MAFFLDTNVICYSVVAGEKQAMALTLLDRRPVISIQTLNECTLVARRKWGYSWSEITDLIDGVVCKASVVRAVDLATHDKGRELAERYQLNIYDSMIVSAALLAGCDLLYSEDMQDGMIIEDSMIIHNPFR